MKLRASIENELLSYCVIDYHSISKLVSVTYAQLKFFRNVPYVMRDRLIQHLQNVTLIRFSEWAATITPVVKLNGNITSNRGCVCCSIRG